MPKGEGSRPFNKPLKTLAKGSFKGTGLAGEADRAKQDNRNWGARTFDNPVMRERERSNYDDRSGGWKTGPENPRSQSKDWNRDPFSKMEGSDPNWKKRK
jgi:hypothetical protein